MTLQSKDAIEIELKFLVPLASRGALAQEMARGASTLERTSLTAMYLDTPDRRLARAGLAWRLRREGRRWIQTLKAGGSNALERFEHEVIRPAAAHDASLHAGTPVGDRLLTLLRRAAADGIDPVVRFRTEVRRTTRRIRTRGAAVEVAFDEGRIVAGESSCRIREVEFELVSGSAAAMLALAERWRKRFGLVYDPRSKAERGDRLAEGHAFPAVRKGMRPTYDQDAAALDAFGSVLDECLSQITRNAIGLTEGDPEMRVDHTHQLRVGIRRLRSALRSFRGWVPEPPQGLEAGLRTLFETLGQSRDADVMESGVCAELAQVGAPSIALPVVQSVEDPAAACRSSAVQQTFLGWITWRTALVESSAPVASMQVQQAGPSDASGHEAAAAPASGEAPVASGSTPPGSGASAALFPTAPIPFPDRAARRLRQWHKRIVADWKAFDELEEEALHELRKRIKRQRYAVEFLSPVLRRRKVDRYLEALAEIQERMGELNDLFVARALYQRMLDTHPQAWFALGWLAARIAEARGAAKPALGRFARIEAPTA